MHAEFVHGRTYMLACMHAGMRASSMYVYAAVLDSCMPIGSAFMQACAHLRCVYMRQYWIHACP